MNVPFSILVKVALRTPRLFASVARETLRSKSIKYLDHHFGRGRALLPPRYIDIKMTNRCNLRCKMCGQWGEQGTMHNASADFIRSELELDELRALVDDVAGFKPMFYLWGGEPLLYADLIPFLAYLQSRGLTAAINTNGVLLAEKAEGLVRHGVANLLISVDGPAEIHDRVRGVPGTFDRVMGGVQKVMEAREARGTANPYITFVTTVNTENDTAFERVYDIAADVGVDFVGLQFGTFTTECTGPAYENRMRTALGCEATNWHGFLSYNSHLDIPAVQEQVRRIRAASHPFGTYFIPDLAVEDIPTYYSSTRPMNGCRMCTVPWMRADLLPNGDVYPCIDFPDYIVGNIRETPLTELWNGERYVQFRRELQQELFPICPRCQTLYEF